MMDQDKKVCVAYEIHFTRAAEKFFEKHKSVLRRYEDAIKQLLFGPHPESVDVKRIQGRKGSYFRIRIGEYRIIYTIINGKIVVIKTLTAGSRGDVCKK